MIRQPWHTEYCHLKFSYSDLTANYATQYMLTLTKSYAVKTGQPRFLVGSLKSVVGSPDFNGQNSVQSYGNIDCA